MERMTPTEVFWESLDILLMVLAGAAPWVVSFAAFFGLWTVAAWWMSERRRR